MSEFVLAFGGPTTEGTAELTWWMNALRVTSAWSATWVLVGFVGQIMFFLRLFIQWIASERRGESVVPPIFWWLSVVGAAMLLAYSIWRADIVFILGQAFGFVVYIRNIYLIHSKSRRLAVTKAPYVAAPDSGPQQGDAGATEAPRERPPA